MSAIPDERAALLAAICAEPEEDTPRLVYGDWLQEHGDEEQARFIREWISLDWLEDYEDERRETIVKRIDSLVGLNGVRWLQEVGVAGTDPVYDRGMVDGVLYTRFEDFVAHAPVLFARVPVREVTIDGFNTDYARPDALVLLAEMSELTRLRALRLSNGGRPVSSDGWARFITSPHLANLEELSVQYAGLSDDDVSVFDRCEHLSHLEELGLLGNSLTADGALAVVRSPRLPNLRRLSLANNNILEDRRRGSPYITLRDALIDRFDNARAL